MQKMQTGNLKEKYKNEISAKLKETLDKKNIYEVPALQKIVINTGFGRLNPDDKARQQIAENLAKITGQKPIFTTAKQAIAAFKIRKKQVIGAKITLRGDKMYHFFEKLVRVVLPRLRDFRGVNEKAFDNRGNYTIGFSEINIFPEIEYRAGEKPVGLEITINTTAQNDEEAKMLLTALGMPFKEKMQPAKKEING